MRKLLASWVALVLFAVPSFAQSPPAATSLVKATAAPVALKAGSTAGAVVHVVVADHWHIYSNPPTLDYNIPTQVSIAGAAGVTGGTPAYPAGRAVKAAGEEQPMSVYDGAFDVPVPLTATATAVNGTHTLRGKVQYQACNDQMCLAPTSVPFTVEVTVTGGIAATSTTTPAAHPDTVDTSPVVPDIGEDVVPPPPSGTGFMTAPPAAGTAAPSAAQQRLEDALRKGWVWWLLALFLGGLALNLTPCVFPMLGITVSIFGARKAETTPRAAFNAVVYVLGIIVTYTVLGVAAALTGGLFGAALQNPLVNVGLGLLLVALSLSMFGFYEMQAPTWVLDRAGGANTGTVAGLFVSGLAVGIIAAPCVGPFVIGVLALIAQRGSVAFGVQTMFTLSLGLGFPYLVLATFSNLLGTMPRAGEWMDWVKKLFGVLLASIGLYYALIGVAARWAPWILPAALVLGGLYLGFMEKSGNAMARFRGFKRLAGVLGVVAGVALALQMTAARSRAIAFRPYDEAAVQASLASGRGVMIDFAADWCVPCHELELQVFPDPRVIAAAKPFDAYKADLTHGDTPASKRYGVSGVPTVIFLGANGAEARAQRVEGFVPAADFAGRLGQAAKTLAP
jgi:thiol:disulfide interchange protein DsbD